jgi:hypothetical protein
VAEARTLLAAAHTYYSEPDKQRCVSAFNRGAAEFSFANVLQACGVTPPR